MAIRVFRARLTAIAAVLLTVTIAAACAPPSVPLTNFPTPTGERVVSVEGPDTVGPLRMRGSELVDGAGRVVLLHGMNSVNKSAPFISLLSDGNLGPADRAYLRTAGLNAIRLGVSYAALMPQPGVIDDDYLDQVVAVVDTLSGDGFWVQLDFHQDVFHMMPAWATPPDALALSDTPPEILSFIGWAAAYTSPRSLRQWDAFLHAEPVEGAGGASTASLLGDAAAALADRVAAKDHVIGIELLNEPFSGSSFLACILEGCPDIDALLGARYAEMTAKIRAVAPQMPVWVEPFAPTGYVAPSTLPMPAVPATSDGAQLGLAWHLYCADTDGGRPVESADLLKLFCQQRFVGGFANGASLAASLGGPDGGPRILNEFGASQNPLDATLVTRLADEQLVSWMYWHHAGGGTVDDSPLPDVVESQIVRPYPQATAGTPRSLRFDPVTGAFEFRFTPDSSIDAPTSIVVPPRQYPNGYDVVVAAATVTSNPQSGRLTVVGDGSGATVTVTLARR